MLWKGIPADPAIRRMLAEHYRTIGALDQAARWGISIPGWVRASELRALRRVLAARVASGMARGYLHLGSREQAPASIADLMEVPERPAAARGSRMRLLAGIAWLGGLLWWGTAIARAIVAMTQGVEVLDALRDVRVEALVAGAIWLVGLLWLRRHPRPSRTDWRRRLQQDAQRRVEAVLPSLVLHGERHALLRGWLDQTWTPDMQEPVRRMLVELARERRRPAEAGRWGIAVDGLTTPDERTRFAATLRADDEWMLELEQRTERAPSRLGADERDALIRAGVAAETIDRRWMTNADRLTEIEHERVARVLDELLATPTEQLRHERAAIVRAATRAPNPEVRRLLAEHYRALGKPEQAGRWGVAHDGWATDDEVRALRLDLLEQRPTHATRTYLGLAYGERLPKAVADLERRGERPEHPLVTVGSLVAIVGVLALVVGVLLLPVGGVLGLLSIEPPGWLWPTIAGCASTVVVAGLVGWAAFVLGDRLEARAPRRDPYARELRWRLPGLKDPAERRSLAIGALESRVARTRRTARHVLVDASRRLGRPDDVARWGASVDGATTADEREALALRLARTRDPVRTYGVLSHRERGPLRADERDVLRRASVPVETMDAFDADG
ncbi:hypothetical protein SAMN04489720_0881 [Agrococcus jejuensis]|uniref:Uncharacterized protein n=2 Tax=Agrococcus jejuensis TaxID=399736 RepID=A0A1G8BDN2_9MICO|nr:hypothetical protein SAMN04489720_0881 [Agrococcus jejuensis]